MIRTGTTTMTPVSYTHLVVGLGECADPQECKAIADLGIDFLAAGIGNIHGKYPENWPGLRFDVLEQVKAAVGDMRCV